MRKFPRKSYTSYYVEYEYEGAVRTAEYCEAPLRHSFREGESLSILIDPKQPPNTKPPEGMFSSSGSGSGDCSLPGAPVFNIWDFFYLAVALALLTLFAWK